MLQPDGSITFIDQVIELLADLVQEYEEKHGAPGSELEQALILTYALGILHCDVCAISDALGKSPVFRSLHPQRLFQECCGDEQKQARAERALLVEDLLRKRGWPCRHQDNSL